MNSKFHRSESLKKSKNPSSNNSSSNNLLNKNKVTFQNKEEHSDSDSTQTNELFNSDDSDTEPQGLRTGQFGRRLSWTSVSTGDLSIPLKKILYQDEHIARQIKLLLNPPEFDKDDILCSVHTFLSSLAEYIPSVKTDKTFQIFRTIRELLISPLSIRLFGLLVHYHYWNIIHPTIRRSLIQLKSHNPAHTNNKVNTIIEELDQCSTKNYSQRFALPKALQYSKREQDKMMKSLPKCAKTLEEIEYIFETNINKLDLDLTNEEEISIATSISPPSSPFKKDDDNFQSGLNSPIQNMRTDLSIQASTHGTLSSEASLSAYEKEQLYIQLETCIVSLFQKIGLSKFSLITSRQALISCCHFVVDEILTIAYPWFASIRNQTKVDIKNDLELSIRQLNLKLRRIVHQSISDLIDPSRIYTSAMLINVLLGIKASENRKAVAHKVQSLSNKNKVGGRGKYYRTSTALLAVMNDSQSYQVRKFLQFSEPLYSQVPGVDPPFKTKFDHDRLKKNQSFNDSFVQAKEFHQDPMLFEIPSRGESRGLNIDSNSSSRPNSSKPQRKPLDFNRLLFDQPEAGYFPNLPLKPKDDNPPLEQLKNNPIENESFEFAVCFPIDQTKQGRYKESKSSKYLSSSLPKLSSDNSLAGYSAVDSIDSITNQSQENNLSLKAQTALMNLIINKTAKMYKTQTQTDQTALRISLIQGGNPDNDF